jgi:hypothetical protein
MQNSLQHSPRVVVVVVTAGVAAAKAKAAAATTVIRTKPHEKRKTLCLNCNKVVVHDAADCFSL